MPRIKFCFRFTRPWDWDQCTLGVYTLKDIQTFEVFLGIYFMEAGVNIEWSRRR
jgi:hypothetical protein